MKFTALFSTVFLLTGAALGEDLNSLINDVENSCYGDCFQSAIKNLCPSNPTWKCLCSHNSFNQGYNSVQTQECYNAAQKCGVGPLKAITPKLSEICVDENSGTGGSGGGGGGGGSSSGSGSGNGGNGASGLSVQWPLAALLAVAAVVL